MTYLCRIPASAQHCFDKLHQAGYEAYLVGGFVRDELLGRISHDLDMTSNASVERMMEIFKGYPQNTVGKRYGTLGVLCEGDWIEITQYRKDLSSANSRHPVVDFDATLEDDLLRRDFSVNALVADSEGKILDFVGGLDDLKSKTICAIGNPTDRFNEDALRILRAIRFAAQLNFTIENKTSDALFAQAHLLKKLSRERIREEWIKLLEAPKCYRWIVQYRAVLTQALPFMAESEVSLYLDETSSWMERWVLLFVNLTENKLDESTQVLVMSSQASRSLIEIHRLVHASWHDTYQLKRILGSYAEEAIRHALNIKKIFGMNIQSIEEDLIKIKAADPVLNRSQLAVNGDDLLAFGFIGKDIAQALDHVLECVMKGLLDNDKEAIEDYLKTAYLDKAGKSR